MHIHSVSSKYDIQVDSLVLAPAPALGLVLDFEIVASEEPAVQSDSGFAAAAAVAVAAEQAVFPVVSLLDFDPAPVQQQDQEQDWMILVHSVLFLVHLALVHSELVSPSVIGTTS